MHDRKFLLIPRNIWINMDFRCVASSTNQTTHASEMQSTFVAEIKTTTKYKTNTILILINCAN